MPYVTRDGNSLINGISPLSQYVGQEYLDPSSSELTTYLTNQIPTDGRHGLFMGNGIPAATLGGLSDCYIDLDSGTIYLKS